MTDLGEAATTVPPGDAAMFPGTEDGAQRRGLFGLAPGSLRWEPQNHRGLARRFITPVTRLRRACVALAVVHRRVTVLVHREA